MKHIFIGDVHGKVEAVETALAKEGKKIFVGDFIDSYDRSVEDHKKCYDLVFDAIDKGDAEAIFGNHELSYSMNVHRCSGWDPKRDFLMKHYQNMIWKRFKPYIFFEPNLLISHAGLTKSIWEDEKLSLKDLTKTLDDWWKEQYSPMHQIGFFRGGNKPVGGLFWCDFNREFESVPELQQIFGHTRGNSIRQQGTDFCIDCLDYATTFLEIDL